MKTSGLEETHSDTMSNIAPQTSQQGSLLDFSQLSPSSFGISVATFMPPQNKEKSRVSQLKAKRRSAVGVRGSPETNSLIRFIAMQKRQTPPSRLLQSSPLLPRHPSSHKQKIASFQSLLEADENEPPEKLLKESSQKEVMSTRSPVENRAALGELQCMEPNSSKKPRLELIAESKEKSSAVLPLVEEEQTRTGPTEISLFEMDEAICPSPVESLGWAESSPQDPSLPSKDFLLAALSSSNTPSKVPVHSSLSPHRNAEGTTKQAQSMKKRVRFGDPLSPEFFDKALPPSTPLQRGGTPACQPSSSSRHLRSLLKTPQWFELPMPQPDFSSPCKDDFSPIQSIGKSEEICVPVVSEEACSVLSDSAAICVSNIPTLVGAEESPPADMLAAPVAYQHLCETGPAEAPELPLTEAPAAPTRSRKRKHPAQSVPVKSRVSRTAAASASNKIKSSTSMRRWGRKEVDRSLYGKREYASKNPDLSPITETLSCPSCSPSLQLNLPRQQPTEDSPLGTPEMQPEDVSSSDSAHCVAASRWRQRFLLSSEDNVHRAPPGGDLTDSTESQELSAPNDSSVLKLAKDQGRRGRRQNVKQKAQQSKRDNVDVFTSEIDEGGNEISLLANETKAETNYLLPSSGIEADVKADYIAVSEGDACMKADVQDVNDKMINSGVTQEVVSEVEEKKDKITRRQGKGRGRRNSRMYHELHKENTVDSSETSKSAEGRETGLLLEGVNSGVKEEKPLLPWQQMDFFTSEVLKPLPRNRLSVRRSLRNQANGNPAMAGLAWVTTSSPVSQKTGGLSASVLTEEPTF